VDSLHSLGSDSYRLLLHSHTSVGTFPVPLEARLKLDVGEVHVMQVPQVHRAGAEGAIFQTPKPHVVQATRDHPEEGSA
jgi:hypothetical protein